jgi:hypothetical protein
MEETILWTGFSSSGVEPAGSAARELSARIPHG